MLCIVRSIEQTLIKLEQLVKFSLEMFISVQNERDWNYIRTLFSWQTRVV